MPASGNLEPLESALAELYGVEPADFVDTRKRLAGALRAAGETDAAKSLQAARRPTTAAWALNQLSRREPALVEAFLDRSRDLEEVQLSGSPGGRDAMREATRAQRDALGAATDAALAMLGSRASDAYRSQILATLHAAGVDEAVGEQLQTGRLIREVTGITGFPDAPGLTLVPDLKDDDEPARQPAAAKPTRRAPEDSDVGETVARATREREERDRRARAKAEEAERRRAEAEAAWQHAKAEVDEAESAAAAAQQQIERLQQDLDQARHEARAAEDRAGRARREAARLARAATKLAKHPTGDA